MYAKVLVVFGLLLILMVSGMASNHSSFAKHHAFHPSQFQKKVDAGCRSSLVRPVKALRVGSSLQNDGCSH